MPRKSTNPLDELAEEGAQRLKAIVDAMPEAVDPVGYRKLTRQEQLEQYHIMRDDPHAWGSLLDEHGLDAVIEYAKTMEALESASDAKDAPLEAEHERPIPDLG